MSQNAILDHLIWAESRPETNWNILIVRRGWAEIPLFVKFSKSRQKVLFRDLVISRAFKVVFRPKYIQ